MRGNHTDIPLFDSTLRSIPARAGEPLGVMSALRLAGVYPRACGGTPEYVANLVENAGLSPRVRGNPPIIGTIGGRDGSIPARAGEPC